MIATHSDSGNSGHVGVLRRLLAAVAFLLLATSPIVAQQQASSSGAPTPWTHQNFLDDTNAFQFAIVSDRAANPREGVFKAALGKIELLRPEFVLSIGDFIHGYGEGFKPLTDEAVVRAKRRKIDTMLANMSMPFYRVAGNHDMNNSLSARIWRELYGPDYYAFTYKGVLFLCLNSQDGPDYGPGIGTRQIAWAKDEIAKHSDARWICLFLHQPLWLDNDTRLQRAKSKQRAVQLNGFDAIEKLLEGRNYTVFAGHQHRYGKLVRNGHKYFRLATTGGSSKLTGPDAGLFDHIVWVTMTDDGPVLCNLLLNGILDEDAKANMPK